MASFYTTNTLIDSIERRAAIPTSQDTFQDEDYLAFANEEISLGLVPSIMRLHEDYFLYTVNIPIVDNQSRYTIPDRAIGNKLRELAFKDNNGNIFEMTRINIEDLPSYNGPVQTSRVYSYYVEYNEIVLTPNVGTGNNGSLMMTYYLRPNTMVTEDKVAIITSINTVTGEITVNSVPSDFSTSSTYDLIKANSPFRTISLDISASAINPVTKVITLDPNDLPSTLAVGDYVNIATETIVPQIPSELHVVLAHRVASRCLESMGDIQALQSANEKLAEMEMNTTTIIDNRVEGSPKKVVSRHSPLRQGLYRRRFRFRS